MSAKVNAAKVLIVGKVQEARKMQAQFHRIKKLLDVVRDKGEDCIVTEEHLEVLFKMFFMGALQHNLAVMIWLWQFTGQIKLELEGQIRREILHRHQVDRLLAIGDRLNSKFEPLMVEIGELERTIQRG
ncbi:hypothetical protein D3C78_927920 [compost metagenome]